MKISFQNDFLLFLMQNYEKKAQPAKDHFSKLPLFCCSVFMPIFHRYFYLDYLTASQKATVYILNSLNLFPRRKNSKLFFNKDSFNEAILS